MPGTILSGRKPSLHLSLVLLLASTLSLALFPLGAPVRATAAATLTLDGSGWLSVDNAPELNPAGGITVEAWVRRTADLPCATIVGKNVDEDGLWIAVCSGKLRVYLADAGGFQDGTRTVALGVWTHVAFTFDGTTRRYYLNGLLDTAVVTPGPLPGNNAPLTLGADSAAIPWAWSGNIAEVRLWNVTRSQHELRRDMVRTIDSPQPGLAGVWHLEGSYDEAFGSFATTIVGLASFDGPAAPPFSHDPIVVTRASTAPTLDGTCSPGEYGPVRLPIWVDYGTTPSLVWVSAVATESDLYICMNEIPLEFEFVGVYFDPDGGGGSTAGPDEYRVLLYGNGVMVSQRGTGSGNYAEPGLSEVDAERGGSEFDWNAEFRLPRSAISSPDAIFRLQFMLHWYGSNVGWDAGWPVDYDWLRPDVWPTFWIDDTALPRADVLNPQVTASHSPAEPSNLAPVVITADAEDDVDVAQVDVYVDGVARRSCSFAGDSDVSVTCSTTGALFSAGRHYYYARVTDHRGRQGFTPMHSLRVTVTGTAPTISANHTPRRPPLGGPVTITVSAHDAGAGVESIRISLSASPFEHLCTFPPGRADSSCSVVVTPPAGMRMVGYSARAVNHEDLEVRLPWMPIVFGSGGIDTDGDGLDDELENVIGTDRWSRDTDGDLLADGWEVLGYGVESPAPGWWVNLPAMGADPRRKDIFLQADYERGARMQPEVFPLLINEFWDHGFIFHVTSENERPRPTDGPVSSRTAEQAAILTDDLGRYWFDPKLSWAVHYMYSLHSPETSFDWYFFTVKVDTNNCPLDADDPQNDPRCQPRNAVGEAYVVLHELGHNLGMGHGGRTGSGDLVLRGEDLWRDGDWDNGNQKPNYNSAMNYCYSGGHQCFNPTTGELVSEVTYLDDRAPALIETALSESVGSPFALWLRGRPCPAGYVPTLMYGCIDGAGQHWVIYSDGNQVRARWRNGSPYETTGLPFLTGGIDWNCDGVISPGTITANINGDGGGSLFNDGLANDILEADDDWADIPYQAGAACFLLIDDPDVIPDGYRDLVGTLVGSTGCYFSATPSPGGAADGESAHTYRDLASLDATPAQPTFAPEAEFTATEPHKDTWPELFRLPGLEVCDGLDNDGDLKVDEGCLDSDKDGISDGIDICRLTSNPDQADTVGDRLGDACRSPQVTDLTAVELQGGAVRLEWKVSIPDVLGFNVYRQPAGGFPAFLGPYPTTKELTFIDQLGGPARYCVRAINISGIETEQACASVGLNHRVWLPTILRQK